MSFSSIFWNYSCWNGLKQRELLAARHVMPITSAGPALKTALWLFMQQQRWLRALPQQMVHWLYMPEGPWEHVVIVVWVIENRVADAGVLLAWENQKESDWRESFDALHTWQLQPRLCIFYFTTKVRLYFLLHLANTLNDLWWTDFSPSSCDK